MNQRKRLARRRVSQDWASVRSDDGLVGTGQKYNDAKNDVGVKHAAKPNANKPDFEDDFSNNIRGAFM